MDINELPTALLLARGKYASVRAEHEETKKRAQILCGSISAGAAQILRAVQPDNNAVIDAVHVASLIAAMRKALDEAEQCADMIGKLSALRAELKPMAWPRDAR